MAAQHGAVLAGAVAQVSAIDGLAGDAAGLADAAARTVRALLPPPPPLVLLYNQRLEAERRAHIVPPFPPRVHKPRARPPVSASVVPPACVSKRASRGSPHAAPRLRAVLGTSRVCSRRRNQPRAARSKAAHWCVSERGSPPRRMLLHCTHPVAPVAFLTFAFPRRLAVAELLRGTDLRHPPARHRATHRAAKVRRCGGAGARERSANPSATAYHAAFGGGRPCLAWLMRSRRRS